MDKDYHGMILFNEWYDYIASAETQHKYALGISLTKKTSIKRHRLQSSQLRVGTNHY